MVALSRSESMLSKLFQYRFGEGGEIEGHSFGNLFIAAMTGILGDFSSAVREVSNILAIKVMLSLSQTTMFSLLHLLKTVQA